MGRDNIITYGIVGLLLTIFFLQCTLSIQDKSVTNDEILHLAAGYSYLKTFDFRMNPEHPPLIKMFSAVPLLFLDLEVDESDPAWIRNKKWEWAHNFMFVTNKDKDPDRILLLARIPVILLGVLLGLYLYIWAKELYGRRAGLFALLLYTFSPNIIAHSRFVTTDLGVSAFVFISLYYFWKYLRSSKYRDLFLAGLMFGFTILAKYTGVYLTLVYGLLVITLVVINRNKEKPLIHGFLRKESLRMYFDVGKVFIIGGVITLLGYGVVRIPYYIKGLRYVIYHSETGHAAFLLGQHSFMGWWYYFIIAFLLKTSLAMIVLVVIRILYSKIVKLDIKDTVFLVTPMVVFFVVFLFNHINIGIRHILPVYPFIIVYVSSLAKINFRGKKVIRWVILALTVFYILKTILIFPDYLAYFNEIAGGPNNGHRYLIDSNIDWGQDLKGLKIYLDEKKIDNITLGYFGKDDPEYRGIDHKWLQCFPSSGIVAVSVNLLQGLNEEQAECTKWLREYEPIDKIGYSIWVYNITEKFEVNYERERFCEEGCKEQCNNAGLRLKEGFFFNDSCSCECVR